MAERQSVAKANIYDQLCYDCVHKPALANGTEQAPKPEISEVDDLLPGHFARPSDIEADKVNQQFSLHMAEKPCRFVQTGHCALAEFAVNRMLNYVVSSEV